MKHAFRIGLLSQKCEKHSKAKFTRSQVYRIKSIWKNFKFDARYKNQLARSLCVSVGAIREIINEINWKEVVV